MFTTCLSIYYLFNSGVMLTECPCNVPASLCQLNMKKRTSQDVKINNTSHQLSLFYTPFRNNSQFRIVREYF